MIYEDFKKLNKGDEIVCVKGRYKWHVVGEIYKYHSFDEDYIEADERGVFITNEGDDYNYQHESYFDKVKFIALKNMSEEDMFALKIGAWP